MSLAYQQILPDGVAQPGRMVYEGLECLDKRYVLGWTIPSKDNPRKIYHVTWDPLTDEIFHYCKASGTHYSVRKCGPQVSKRPYAKLCRHCKKIKRFLVKHREEAELTKQTLVQVYELEQSA